MTTYDYVWSGSNTGNLRMLKEGVKQQGEAVLHSVRMGVTPLYATISRRYFDCMVFILQHVDVMLPITEDYQIALRTALWWESTKCAGAGLRAEHRPRAGSFSRRG